MFLDQESKSKISIGNSRNVSPLKNTKITLSLKQNRSHSTIKIFQENPVNSKKSRNRMFNHKSSQVIPMLSNFQDLFKISKWNKNILRGTLALSYNLDTNPFDNQPKDLTPTPSMIKNRKFVFPPTSDTSNESNLITNFRFAQPWFLKLPVTQEEREGWDTRSQHNFWYEPKEHPQRYPRVIQKVSNTIEFLCGHHYILNFYSNNGRSW